MLSLSPHPYINETPVLKQSAALSARDRYQTLQSGCLPNRSRDGRLEGTVYTSLSDSLPDITGVLYHILCTRYICSSGT